MNVMFDTALDAAVAMVQGWYTAGRLQLRAGRFDGIFVRDALGRVALLLGDDSAVGDIALLPALREELRGMLGSHAFPSDAVVMIPGDHPAPDSVLDNPLAIRLSHEPARLGLLDRLQTNQDWLRPPERTSPPLPLGVAYSIKGGVGRSTAFAIWALALARKGFRVLVIDLDLEAPGIGPLLLRDQLPPFGVVDWLVESLVDNASAELLSSMAARAPAAMSADVPGDLRVIPAWGRETTDYVNKLGRAYMPHGMGVAAQGFADSLNALVDAIAAEDDPPHVILLDARAGLHDIGAAAITQLGAQVFIFGRDERQSWLAYKQLFAHLRLSPQVGTDDEDTDLRLRLKMVAAMMDDLGLSSRTQWLNASYDAWLGLYDADGGAYSFDQSNEEAPHYPLAIMFNQAVKHFDFTADGGGEWPLIYPAFDAFVATATDLLLAEKEQTT